MYIQLISKGEKKYKDYPECTEDFFLTLNVDGKEIIINNDDACGTCLENSYVINGNLLQDVPEEYNGKMFGCYQCVEDEGEIFYESFHIDIEGSDNEECVLRFNKEDFEMLKK